MSKALVISAFPACGKSDAITCISADAYASTIEVLDSDSGRFSWILDKNGYNTGVRNTDFPANYIAHIKKNLDDVDIIFVSSDLIVRQALTDAGIDYITVYPEENLRDEWIERLKNQLYTKSFIESISDNWDKLMREINDEPHGLYLYRLNADFIVFTLRGMFFDIYYGVNPDKYPMLTNYEPLKNALNKMAVICGWDIFK